MALTSWMSNIRVLRLVDTLRDRAAGGNGFPAYTYLEDGEAQGGSLSWAELDRQARTIAAHLGAVTARGERALLLYPAGPGLHRRVLRLPLCRGRGGPRLPARPNRGQPRLRAIVRDARPAVVLTTRGPGAEAPAGWSRRSRSSPPPAGWPTDGLDRRPRPASGATRGRPGRTRLPPVHLRLDRGSQGGDGQPRQPARQRAR